MGTSWVRWIPFITVDPRNPTDPTFLTKMSWADWNCDKEHNSQSFWENIEKNVSVHSCHGYPALPNGLLSQRPQNPRPPVAWVLVPETGLEAIGWSLLVHQGQSLVFPWASQPVIGKPRPNEPPNLVWFCGEWWLNGKTWNLCAKTCVFWGGRMGGVSTKPPQDSLVQCLGSIWLDFFCWRVFLEPNRLRNFGRVDRTPTITNTQQTLAGSSYFFDKQNGLKTGRAQTRQQKTLDFFVCIHQYSIVCHWWLLE